MAELRSLTGKDWEAYHAGYVNHIVNSNPNSILPRVRIEASGLGSQAAAKAVSLAPWTVITSGPGVLSADAL